MSFHHRQYDMKSNSYTYRMDDDILEQVDTLKDLKDIVVSVSSVSSFMRYLDVFGVTGSFIQYKADM